MRFPGQKPNARLTSLQTACSQPCDTDHLCAFNTDNELCDGTSFVACGGGNRNQRVPCVRTPKTAVCTPTGWTFDNASQ